MSHYVYTVGRKFLDSWRSFLQKYQRWQITSIMYFYSNIEPTVTHRFSDWLDGGKKESLFCGLIIAYWRRNDIFLREKHVTLAASLYSGTIMAGEL